MNGWAELWATLSSGRFNEDLIAHWIFVSQMWTNKGAPLALLRPKERRERKPPCYFKVPSTEMGPGAPGSQPHTSSEVGVWRCFTSAAFLVLL